MSEIVEIGYLYVVSSLVQPVYRGVRTDQTLAACTTGQLKFKVSIGEDDVQDNDAVALEASVMQSPAQFN